MKITFILAAADLSGGNRVISIYADRLRRRGHQITLISRPWPIASFARKLLAFFRGQPIPSSIPYGPSHFDKLTGIEHRRTESYRPIAHSDVPDADVVIATWWETAEWIAAFPSHKGKKVYFIQHFEVHQGLDVNRVEATWRLPMKKIVVARWLAEIAQTRFGDTNVSLVPNAVDHEQFNAPPRGKQTTPTVGVMYSTVEFKGCDIALRAIELARKEIAELKVVAFGNRVPVAQLPLPTGTDYRVQPPQDHLRDIYNRCDAWLVASRSEGFGLPILEAMACRTPVIATPTGAAPELLSDGAGVLVPIDDPVAMAREIVRIAKLDEHQWGTISDKAHSAAARYNWDDSTLLFEAAIQS